MEGVEDAKLGKGPVVFVVCKLLAGPDDDIFCLCFRPFWFLETIRTVGSHMQRAQWSQMEHYLVHQLVRFPCGNFFDQ